MSGVALAALAVLMALLSLVVRQHRAEYGVVVALACGVGLLLLLLGSMGSLVEPLKQLVQKSGVDTGWLSLLIKALGICLVTQFAADACRDAGQTALAAKAELAGRISVVGLALPMLLSMLETVSDLLG